MTQPTQNRPAGLGMALFGLKAEGLISDTLIWGKDQLGRVDYGPLTFYFRIKDKYKIADMLREFMWDQRFLNMIASEKLLNAQLVTFWDARDDCFKDHPSRSLLAWKPAF